MNITQLFEDFYVPFITEGKNCSPGWVTVHCPYCDDPSTHLGYNLSRDYFRCWRCGWKPFTATLAKLLNVDEKQIFHIVSQYQGSSRIRMERPQTFSQPFKYPNGTLPMFQQHRQYLIKRGFDPDHLTKIWNLHGTGPVSLLGKSDYSHRIIAPIWWNGKEVSFQARDITNKAKLRYKACPKNRETIHHKDILYGKQAEWGDVGICVEGITDVWRFGVKSFATFGIEFKIHQVKVMAENFKKVVVIFDPEPQAQKQARRLIVELKMKGVDAENILLSDAKDPGSMEQKDADALVKQILKEK